MQSSRECVLRAIENRKPDRVPMWIILDQDANNYPLAKDVLKDFETDIIFADASDPDFICKGEGYIYLGYKMESFGETMGEVVDPPLADWAEFDQWKASLPDFTKEVWFAKARQLRNEHPDKFLVGGLCRMLMEEIINLRGYANYMMDFYDEEERLNALIDVLYEMATQMVDGYAAAGMDAVIGWEDWGLQNTPMISYALWEKFFYKKMKAFVEHIHEKGMKYMLHSCGHIIYLMDAFEDMGIDVLQFDQQKNMGLDVLRKWQGKFCFCCPTDIQHSMFMSEEEMSSYLSEMAGSLGSENGGFIFKTYPSPAAIHMPKEQLYREVRLASKL